jgi:undecaprenyl-diphosphatase
MAAATALDLFKSAGAFTQTELSLLFTGFAVSFVVALLSIVWLLRFLKHHSFIPFGIYRIAIAVCFLLLMQASFLA